MKRNPCFQTSRKERIAFPLFAVGQLMIFGFVGQFASLFFTEYLLIPTAALSVIFLVAKIWDAVNDPMFGIIVDRVQFKKAKFKPWLKVTAFLVPLCTILMFCIPASLPMNVKIALAAAAYVVWSMVYTVSDVPNFSLMTTLTSNARERTTLLSYSSVAGSFGAILIVIVFLPMTGKIGFSNVALILGLLAFPMLAIYPFVAKERYRAPAPQRNKFADIFTYLKKNKYLLVFYLSFCICGVLNVTLTNYVLIACFGNINLLAVFTAIGVLPVIILFLLVPKISQKVDRMTMYLVCIVSSIVLNGIIYFVGYASVYAYGALVIVRTVIATPSTLLVATFTTDCIEYGHFKTGLRKEGLTFSFQTFANKFNNAIASSLAMLLLTVVGYVGGEGVMQSPETLSGLWAYAHLIPAAGALLSLPLLKLYKLRSKDIQIMTDINAGKLCREEGERMMSRKY